MEDMRTKLLTTLLLTCFMISGVKAQIKVGGMTETTEFIPGDDQRRDYNEDLCALVKVQVLDEITDVEGNVMGDIVRRGVEKWVYMAEGSRNMKIHLKNSLPITIKFKDYGINSLKGNRVYILTMENGKTEPIMIDFTLRYTPINATVLIDAKTYKGDDGVINVKLSEGQHNYIVTADGYEPGEGAVNLKSGKTGRLQVDLVKIIPGKGKELDKSSMHESQFSTKLSDDVKVGVNGNLLTLKISPFYAKVGIDGITYEADGDGELTIPLLYGTHAIIVEAEGYSTNETSINIRKGVTKKIKLSKLKESKSKVKKGVVRKNNDDIEIGKTGNLFVLYLKYLDGLKVTVDDDVWISNQEKIKAIEYYLPYGTHEVKVECNGYETFSFSVNIGKSKVSRSVKLKKKGKKGNGDGVSSTNNYDSKGVVAGLNGNQVVISVKPIYATVIVDDAQYNPDSKGKVTENLLYGVHTILVEAEGYVTQRFTIDVGKKGISKSVKLKKNPRKK